MLRLNKILSKLQSLPLYCILFLCILTLILYCRSAWNEFLFKWDDQWVVINTYTDQGFSLHNLWHILTDFYHGQYAPLNELLYVIMYKIDGYNPTIFHIGTILLHVTNVVLVFIFTKSLLTSILSQNKPYSAVKRGLTQKAFLTAIIFAVHPLCVESVSWLSASKILVYSLFYLLGLILYLKYIRSASHLLYLLVILLFVLSFGGKEQAVVFFLSCILINWVVMRNESWWIIVLEKVPLGFLALLFGVITIISQVDHGNGLMPVYNLYERFLLAFYSLFEYVVKTIFPYQLSYIYPFPFQPGDEIPFKIYLYPIFIKAIGGIIYKHRKTRSLIFWSYILSYKFNCNSAYHINFTLRCDC